MFGLHNLETTFKSRLLDYIIWNIILKKYIMDYIIRKLFSNSRLIFERWHKKDKNVYSYFIWGGWRTYVGAGRNSPLAKVW